MLVHDTVNVSRPLDDVKKHLETRAQRTEIINASIEANSKLYKDEAERNRTVLYDFTFKEEIRVKLNKEALELFDYEVKLPLDEVVLEKIEIVQAERFTGKSYESGIYVRYFFDNDLLNNYVRLSNIRFDDDKFSIDEEILGVGFNLKFGYDSPNYTTVKHSFLFALSELRKITKF